MLLFMEVQALCLYYTGIYDFSAMRILIFSATHSGTGEPKPQFMCLPVSLQQEELQKPTDTRTFPNLNKIRAGKPLVAQREIVRVSVHSAFQYFCF